MSSPASLSVAFRIVPRWRTSRRKPAVFIRKESKSHGKSQRIEGGEVSGKRVLLLEDLVTTGSSSLSAVNTPCAKRAR